MKRNVVLLWVALASASPLMAHAGYAGPDATVQPTRMSARDALKAADDTRVILEGRVVKKLDKDHYLFRDASGDARVEIDGKYMPATKFDASTRVRLTGEVDREPNNRDEIDIKHVEILP